MLNARFSSNAQTSMTSVAPTPPTSRAQQQFASSHQNLKLMLVAAAEKKGLMNHGDGTIGNRSRGS
jgi:hypothetical protein